MGDDLAHLLPIAGIDSRWADSLVSKGVHGYKDLLFVSNLWLTCLGLSNAEAHQLLVTAWSTHSVGGPEEFLNISTFANLKQAHVKALLESSIALVTAEGGPVLGCLAHALEHLEWPDPRNGALALTACTRGQTLCKNPATREMLGETRLAVRDAFVWRVQMASVWGDRTSFLSELEKAYGRSLDQLSISRMLQSHNQTVAMNFPSAFLSTCKSEADARGGGRPARRKK
jgi:hypothetical protein